MKWIFLLYEFIYLSSKAKFQQKELNRQSYFLDD